MFDYSELVTDICKLCKPEEIWAHTTEKGKVGIVVVLTNSNGSWDLIRQMYKEITTIEEVRYSVFAGYYWNDTKDDAGSLAHQIVTEGFKLYPKEEN